MIEVEYYMYFELLVVALGGGIGAVSRFGLSRAVQSLSPHVSFPLGILVCNILGSFLIGILYALLVNRFDVSAAWRAFILIGFLGGFTTFSSFSLDTVNLLMQHLSWLALVNVMISVAGCLLATVGGMSLVRLFCG